MGIDDITYGEDGKMKNELTKRADKAMFDAQPHDWDPENGVIPKVYLLWMTPDPLGACAAMNEMYKGNVIRDMANDLTDDMRRSAWEGMMKTHLTAPLEAIKMHFLFEGVDRAFEQQLTRQRTAVYAGESLRFAVIDDLIRGTSLPPSLHGSQESSLAEMAQMDISLGTMLQSEGFSRFDQRQRRRAVWDYLVRTVSEGVTHLLDDGMPGEDARGLLPLATATRIEYITDMRNLVDHAGNRLCTQAQFHWRWIFNQIVKAIANYLPDFSWVGSESSGFGTSQRTQLAKEWNGINRWQYSTIANSNLFRPKCYQLGHCAFDSEIDRACVIRGRVKKNAEAGIASEDWGHDSHLWDGFAYPSEDPLRSDHNGIELAGPINPAEWLLRDDAARVQ